MNDQPTIPETSSTPSAVTPAPVDPLDKLTSQFEFIARATGRPLDDEFKQITYALAAGGQCIGERLEEVKAVLAQAVEVARVFALTNEALQKLILTPAAEAIERTLKQHNRQLADYWDEQFKEALAKLVAVKAYVDEREAELREVESRIQRGVKRRLVGLALTLLIGLAVGAWAGPPILRWISLA